MYNVGDDLLHAGLCVALLDVVRVALLDLVLYGVGGVAVVFVRLGL